MPRWIENRPDGGAYVLKTDRDAAPEQQVRFLYRDPLPSEIASFEDSTGFHTYGEAVVLNADGERPVVGLRKRYHSNGAANNIRALLLFLTDVVGPGPDGRPLAWPKGEVEDGTDDYGRPRMRRVTEMDRERFLARFAQAELYEVAEHILERGHLTEGERGN